MNSNPFVYCLLDCSINLQDFSIEINKGFSFNELIYLRKTLTDNLIEDIIKANDEQITELCLFISDENENNIDLYKEFSSDKINFSYFSNKEKFFEHLNKFSNFFLIYTDSIGLSPFDIKNTGKLILSDDISLVISKSENDEICFIAFNNFDNNLIDLMLQTELSYDNFLSKVKSEKFFIHTISGHFRVNNFTNFKQLYNKLSQKESLEYCSQEMHEKFTNLFIEYRDYLK